MLKIGDLPGVGALLGRLLWGHISTPRRRLTVQQRLSEVPLTDAPLRAPITIRWDEHMIPFIEAESEADLAVGLGIVHAHLRLAQMEFMRVASQGRLSEWLGPLARGRTIPSGCPTSARVLTTILRHCLKAPVSGWTGLRRGLITSSTVFKGSADNGRRKCKFWGYHPAISRSVTC